MNFRGFLSEKKRACPRRETNDLHGDVIVSSEKKHQREQHLNKKIECFSHGTEGGWVGGGPRCCGVFPRDGGVYFRKSGSKSNERTDPKPFPSLDRTTE